MNTSRRSLGTLAWARHTGGRLSRSNQLKLLMEAALLQLNARLRRQQQPPFFVDLGSIRVPDSGLCTSASELLTSVSEPWLVNHCLRTFLWAAILGKKGQHRFDEELLFVASALHDLGLTSAGARLSPSNAECFAVEGAFAAETVPGEAGCGPQATRSRRRSDLLAPERERIAVGRRRGPPAARGCGTRCCGRAVRRGRGDHSQRSARGTSSSRDEERSGCCI